MKYYLLIQYNRQTLRPHIEKMFEFSTRSNETVEQVLREQFDFDGFEDNHSIIELDTKEFGNTSDRRFNVIQMHSLSTFIKEEV